MSHRKVLVTIFHDLYGETYSKNFSVESVYIVIKHLADLFRRGTIAFRSRPLWEIPVLARTPGNEIILNCDECLQVIEYQVEATLAENQTVKIRAILQEHMKHCPHCREHHEKWLMEMEIFFQAS